MKEIIEIYNQYKKDVYRYLCSLSKDALLAEDLTSETFYQAIKSLPSFRGDSDIKTWLFSIARYQWYGYLKKNKELLLLDDQQVVSTSYLEDIFSNSFSQEENFIQKERVKHIQTLIQLENEKSQRVFYLRLQGYSYYEISLQLKISESSARVLDHRIKKNLREKLKEDQR